VAVGTLLGLLLGLVSAPYLRALLYQVTVTDVTMLALPSVTVIVVALVAALPAAINAVGIDPVKILRAE
jgi:putative ABC transport system permease protein